MPEYVLTRNKRSRSIRISVSVGGAIRVSAPPRAPLTLIEQTITKNVDWIHRQQKKISSKHIIHINTADIPSLKQHTKELLDTKLPHFAKLYGVVYKQVAIRDQKSRWGSCSARGNLNFNYKLALLPPQLADYIIIHELCHLREMNHSAKFWKLVVEACPRYKEYRKELRNMIVKVV